MNCNCICFVFIFTPLLYQAKFYSTTQQSPRLILKPFEKNRDIKYVKLSVPKHTRTFTAQFTLQSVGKCNRLGLELYIQPKSLPVIRPFQVPLPPGVHLSTSSLVFVHRLKDSLSSSSYSKDTQNTEEIKCPIYARESGEWFIALYISGGLQTGNHENDSSCRVWVFPQILFDIIILKGQLSVPFTYPSSTSGLPSLVNKNGIDDDPQGLVSLTLLPTEENVFSFIAPEGASSVDLVLHRCFTANPQLPSSNNSRHSNDWHRIEPLERCPVTFEMRVGGIPLSTISEVETDSSWLHGGKKHVNASLKRSLLRRKFEKPFINNSNKNNNNGLSMTTTSTTVKAKLTKSAMEGEVRPGEVFLRLSDVRGDQELNYVYMKNHRLKGDVLVQILLRPNFDCHISEEYNKSPLPSGDADNSQVQRSLLPWVNASWIELTPMTGLVSSTMSTERMGVNPGDFPLNLVSTPNSMQGIGAGETKLARCSIWPPLTRSDLAIPFAFQFSFQPKFGRLENLIHLKPWYVVAIPFDLMSSQDSGGSLEVSLQLEPFDVFHRVNGSMKEQRPQRQVILHACLSRSVAITPESFTSPDRCPLWFRLATSGGLPVSVRQALMDAVQAELARSQPPHRSERMPDFDVREDERVDRSFLFTPYPAPERWYLSLYAECYSSGMGRSDINLCTPNTSANIDVMAVVQSKPCVNQRCRDIGEPASLPPGRVTQQRTSMRQHWRPLWWWRKQRQDAFSIGEPLPGDADFNEEFPRNGEGICTEMLQQTTFASSCSCPPGRAGLGCMLIPTPVILTENLIASAPWPKANRQGEKSESTTLMPELQAKLAIWPNLSEAAKLLVWSNIAFLPACLVALYRRLWIPFLAYLYTMTFSSLYHICDTDVLVLPASLPERVVGGSHQAFGGFAIAYSDIYKLHGYIQQQFRAAATNMVVNITANQNQQRLLPDSDLQISYLRFSSLHCPLPHDTLSLCDFFGGVFCISVTILAASALPSAFSEVICIVTVLGLTVAVQVARFSVWFYLLPLCSLLSILVVSWTYRSIRLRRLFPPVQWLILSFLPGIILALSGFLIFISRLMENSYTTMHSLWHTLIAFSILGILPWPDRWRRCLKPIIPLSTPLSCGGTKSPSDTTGATKFFNRLLSNRSTSEGSSMQRSGDVQIINAKPTTVIKRIRARCCGKISSLLAFKDRLEARLDEMVELNWFLDRLVKRFPRLWWILPLNYVAHRCSIQPVRGGAEVDADSPESSTPSPTLLTTINDSNC